LKQVLLRNIHTQTHTGGKGFARGFMERTQWIIELESIPATYISQCSELLLFFHLDYNDKPERTSAQIKIGLLQLHGFNWNRQMRRHIHWGSMLKAHHFGVKNVCLVLCELFVAVVLCVRAMTWRGVRWNAMNSWQHRPKHIFLIHDEREKWQKGGGGVRER
jgi:hypothetical protein